MARLEKGYFLIVLCLGLLSTAGEPEKGTTVAGASSQFELL
jgi:hypothetical protein